MDTDGQNIYRIAVHIWEECAQKIRTLSLLGAEKIAFPTKPDIRTNG